MRITTFHRTGIEALWTLSMAELADNKWIQCPNLSVG